MWVWQWVNCGIQVWTESAGRWVSRVSKVRVRVSKASVRFSVETVISAWVNPRTFTPQFTHCHTHIPTFYP